jgi:hypothetical protein
MEVQVAEGLGSGIAPSELRRNPRAFRSSRTGHPQSDLSAAAGRPSPLAAKWVRSPAKYVLRVSCGAFLEMRSHVPRIPISADLVRISRGSRRPGVELLARRLARRLVRRKARARDYPSAAKNASSTTCWRPSRVRSVGLRGRRTPALSREPETHRDDHVLASRAGTRGRRHVVRAECSSPRL